MLTRSDIRAIDQIVEKAIRMGLATKHHRYSLAEALRKRKTEDPSLNLQDLLSSASLQSMISSLISSRRSV